MRRRRSAVWPGFRSADRADPAAEGDAVPAAAERHAAAEGGRDEDDGAARADPRVGPVHPVGSGRRRWPRDDEDGGRGGGGGAAGCVGGVGGGGAGAGRGGGAVHGGGVAGMGAAEVLRRRGGGDRRRGGGERDRDRGDTKHSVVAHLTSPGRDRPTRSV